MLLKNYHILYNIKSFALLNTTKWIIFLWTKVGSSGRAVTTQKSDAESEQMSLAQLCIF